MKVLLEIRDQLKDADAKHQAASGLPKTASGEPDYSKDFFGRNAFLAVSGQLNAETYACALTDVYTFGELQVCKILGQKTCSTAILACMLQAYWILNLCWYCEADKAMKQPFKPINQEIPGWTHSEVW